MISIGKQAVAACFFCPAPAVPFLDSSGLPTGFQAAKWKSTDNYKPGRMHQCPDQRCNVWSGAFLAIPPSCMGTGAYSIPLKDPSFADWSSFAMKSSQVVPSM